MKYYLIPWFILSLYLLVFSVAAGWYLIVQ